MSASLCVLLVVVAACSGGGDDLVSSDAPGYEGDRPDVDRSEFELARPDREGPTTIAGPGPTLAKPWETTVPSTSSAPNLTTTTIVLPDSIGSPESSDRICRAFFFVASGVRAGQKLISVAQRNEADVDFADVRDPLSRSMQSAAESLTPLPRDGGGNDLATVFHRRLRSSVELIEATTSFDQAGGFMYPLVAAPPTAGEQLDWSDIENYLNQACPNLIRELTGSDTLVAW